MRVRLLGSLDVESDDGVRPVTGRRRQAVLAALALHPSQTVGSDLLVDLVWGDSPPASATTTLQNHVSYLRGVLNDRSSIVTEPPGYRLSLGPEPTDVQVAERLINEASRATNPAVAAERSRAALALWRGRPLAELAHHAWFDHQATRLEGLRRQARHALVDNRLALGEHTDLIPELSEATLHDPYDERTCRQLMLAFYRAGRQSDALAAYQRLRRALHDELGVRPGPALRELESAILRQDPSLDLPAPRDTTVTGRPRPPGTPAQLPLALPTFTGRTAQIAQLDNLLEGTAGAGTAGAAQRSVICALTGTAGVGKTTLAVHWAYRIAHRFPDGQLYVNLRGFDPDGTTLAPADVLRGFLDALDVSPDRIPAGLPERAALYRGLLAGRRVLVVLDNARDAEQVRPLLPAAPDCLTVVTSRDQLTGLVTAEDAHAVGLDLFSQAEARQLLARRLGDDRTAAEPDAVDELVERCARLPLALAITAARAATNPRFPLSAVAAELRRTATSLDALQGGDAATDVRSVFSWSVRTVSPDAARLFRLLSLHSGPDTTAPAAASLAAVPVGRTRALLSELDQAHLVTEHVAGRYSFHDLLRAYAADQSTALDDERSRQSATDRMLDHYLRSARTAAVLLGDAREPITLEPARPGVVPEVVTDLDAALAWFSAEHRVLTALIERAAETGHDRETWQLVWTLSTYLLRQGHWQEQVTMLWTAIEAARRLDEWTWQSESLHALARAYSRLRDFDRARQQYERALEVCLAADDATGQAHNHGGLAEIAEQQDRYGDALRHNQSALELFRVAGDPIGEAQTLNSVGWCHSLIGEQPQALTACTEALELALKIDDAEGQATTWDSLGCIHRKLADFEQAITCHRHSVDMCRKIGDRYWEARALVNFGDTYEAAGDAAAAATIRRQALAIFDELHHPEAAEIRAKLP